MKINGDEIFGMHAAALKFRERRAEVIASNIANADTPGYKARDIDFSSMLSNEKVMQNGLVTTSNNHITSFEKNSSYELKYRYPLQSGIDKNSVNMHLEQAEFAKNSVQYQASLEFLDSKIKGILQAIRGE